MLTFSLQRLKTLGVTLCLALGAASALGNSYNDLNKAPAGSYVLDKTHGYVTFSYLHQGYSRPWLRFRDIDATLELDGDKLTDSTVTVAIDPASIDSGVDVFDEHLRGKKFFDVEKFPSITFTSTDLALDGESLTLTGDLTVKGITKSVTLTGQFNQGGLHFRTKKPMLGFSAKTQIKRSEWDLGYAVPMVGDAVDLVVEVEFNQQ